MPLNEDQRILEGLVTTLSSAGAVNVAPMGPIVDDGMRRLILRPFHTAQTYRNLKQLGVGVLHVTDDVELLARAALGRLEPPPPLAPATVVKGFVLADCCQFFEFRVETIDESGERTRIEAAVVHRGHVRDFFGLNRAKHAVVEAAILATRVHLIPAAEIDESLDRLAPLVEKTGAAAEHRAFALIRDHIAELRSSKQAH